ncbi:T-complex protein 1 subunit epsilon [Vespula maculifrons]|uniref:T-complex protein 1 subunit epsilon n=1 Tax=Vespula maculifrons TaxID=7453 RepID=A0ABD2B9B4_VESMC
MVTKCITDDLKRIIYKFSKHMKNLESYIKIDMICYEQIAEIAVNAILVVYDHNRRKICGVICQLFLDNKNNTYIICITFFLIRDALCIVHNILSKDKKILYGGGAVGISYKLVCSTEAKAINTSEQYTFHAFVEVLKAAEMALVENSDAFVKRKAQ